MHTQMIARYPHVHAPLSPHLQPRVAATHYICKFKMIIRMFAPFQDWPQEAEEEDIGTDLYEAQDEKDLILNTFNMCVGLNLVRLCTIYSAFTLTHIALTHVSS